MQHNNITYDKIITEELVAFDNKLSVVASCSERVVLICFIREKAMIKHDLD